MDYICETFVYLEWIVVRNLSDGVIYYINNNIEPIVIIWLTSCDRPDPNRTITCRIAHIP